MPYIFTNFARANVASFGGATVKMALFHQAPSFAQNDARYLTVQTVADLRSRLGWTEVNVTGYPNDAERVVTTLVGGASTYLLMSELAVDDPILPVSVRAIAFYLKGVVGGVTDPVILITTTPVGSGLVLQGGDRIAPRPVDIPIPNSKWLLGWATSNPSNSLTEGALSAQRGNPDYEPSHVQHAWMYPQRTNFVANPSFELGVNHWRSNGTASRVDASVGSGVKAGKFKVDGKQYDSYLTLNGTSPITTPDHASLDILGNLDIRADVAPNDWTPAAAQTLMAKHSSLVPASGGYNLRLDPTGTISLNWSDGVATLTKTSTVPIGLADGTRAIVRAILEVNNGASGHNVRFFYSTDNGATWPQIGATVVTAGITSIGNSTYALTVGSSVLSTNGLVGKIYSAEVRNGVNGTIVANPDFRYLASGTTTVTDSTGKVWTKSAGAVLTSTPRPFGGRLVVESNKFPALSPHFTVQLLAKANGRIKVGLITWPVEYNETNVDWGGEDWVLPGDYAHLQALRSAPQPYECQLRIEVDGTELTIDDVLVENDYLLDWPYFDGDTTHGARDDHSWYGGENLKGQTYSLWYNNKRATAGRLFATAFPDRAAMTSEDELSEGLAYRWVPAGVIVEPHWDVLWPFDLRHPIVDVAGTTVTPHKTAALGTPAWAADMGVASPW